MYTSLCELKHDTSEYFHNDKYLLILSITLLLDFDITQITKFHSFETI